MCFAPSTLGAQAKHVSNPVNYIFFKQNHVVYDSILRPRWIKQKMTKRL